MTAGKKAKACAECGEEFTPRNSRQKFCSADCRNGKPKKAAPTGEERVIAWAVAHGAPTRLLEGWDPDEGKWDRASPMGQTLAKIRKGMYWTVAGRQFGFHDLHDLVSRAADYASSAAENREWIPIEVRPLVDMYREVHRCEAEAEGELVEAVFKDRRQAMAFLGRRWPSRWREQQAVSTSWDPELAEREAAIASVLSDPAKAAALSDLADDIEDAVEAAERSGA